MRGEILACGTELLMGEIVDTNSAYLAARLPATGVHVQHVSLVGDRMEDLVAAFRRGAERSDVILTTGGLGPTPDDLTREAIAAALGEDLAVDPQLLVHLERTFQARGTAMPEGNIKQATRIPSAQSLPNPMGTAPGWWVEKDGLTIVAMPGVPPELERMWLHEVAPRLRQRQQGVVILSRTLKTFGYAESAISDQLRGLFGRENPYLGIYAKVDGIQLRIIARGDTEADARRLLEPLEADIRRILGPAIWGVDDETMETRLGDLLRQRGMSLAVMESCTGGLLASIVTDVPGSSDYFLGGVITYATEAKSAYGVDPALIERHGVVSAPVAQAMAQAVRARFGADVGVGITGAAGPDALGDAAPGTVYTGVAWEGGEAGTSNRYPPNRPLVKRRAVGQALLLVYRTLLERGA